MSNLPSPRPALRHGVPLAFVTGRAELGAGQHIHYTVALARFACVPSLPSSNAFILSDWAVKELRRPLELLPHCCIGLSLTGVGL